MTIRKATTTKKGVMMRKRVWPTTKGEMTRMKKEALAMQREIQRGKRRRGRLWR